MTAPDRCPRCNSGAWWLDYDDKTVTAVCLMCAERIFIRDGRAEARNAELAAVRGLHLKHGPRPKGDAS